MSKVLSPAEPNGSYEAAGHYTTLMTLGECFIRKSNAKDENFKLPDLAAPRIIPANQS